MAGQGTIGAIFDALVDVVQPLGTALSSPERLEIFLERFGFSAPASGLASAASNLSSLQAALAAVGDQRSSFRTAQESGNTDFGDLLAFGEQVVEAIGEAKDFPSLLSSLGITLPSSLPGEVFDLLLTSYLANYQEPVYRSLVLLGLIEQRVIPASGGAPEARDIDYVKVTIRWDRIGTLFSDPAGLFEDVYGWRTAEFDTDLLIARLQLLFQAFEIVARTGDMDADALTQLYPSASTRPIPPQQLRMPLYSDAGALGEAEAGLVLTPVGGVSGPTDAGLGLLPYAQGTLELDIPISETISLLVRGRASFAGGLAATLRPESGFQFEVGLFDSTIPIDEFKVELVKGPAQGSDHIILLGDPEPGSRLDCTAIVLGIGGGPQDFYIAGGVRGLRVVVRSESDGLLHMLLPEGITVEGGDIIIGWRPDRGVYFEGGAGLRVILPVDLELGPIAISQIEVRLGFAPNPSLGLLVNATLTIGPLFLGAEGLGLGFELVPSPNGAFGNSDLKVGLLPPTGYAASLDGGPIKGGGAIFITDTGYMGALALQFQSFGFAAFAILTTKMPGGAPGFSFLASIFCNFEIQLGYGFKLTGLGGLIGIHRTMQIEELGNVLRAGNLDGLLFPDNPIADAARILRDMERVFPPREGQFVFGPMVRLGWCTPTLIEATLGVVIELGASIRIAILGKVRAALPTKDNAVVVLGIDFLGAIDFDARTISFDATLANSRILEWPISGDMALRTGWGEGADFVLSVGGFHPDFPVPTGFPTLRRLSINFGGNNPRITLSAYLAITLNTAQAGARIELWVDGPDIPLIGDFDVDGCAYFDALLQFTPFSFDVALGLGLALLRNGDPICSIGGALRLRGPNPYHLTGKVWAEVLGIEVKVKIDETFGQGVEDLPQLVDALELLLAAARDASYWEPVAAAAHRSGVGFAGSDPAAAPALLMDPVGGLRFAQRVIPLDVTIERLSTARLANDFNRFSLRLVDAAGTTLASTPTRTPFASGQFFDLSDSERLAAPASESYVSGAMLTGADELSYPAAAVVPMAGDYETLSLLAPEAPSASLGTQVLRQADRHRWVHASGIRHDAFPAAPHYVDPRLQGDRIGVRPERFVSSTGASTARGLVPETDAAVATSYGERREAHPGAAVVADYLADPQLVPGGS